MGYSWSVNEENYQGEFATREEAVEEGIDDVDCDEGQQATIWTGRNVPFEPSPDWLGSIVIEHISENGFEECGDAATDWYDRITPEQKIALGKLIVEAVERICPVQFWHVEDVQKHTAVK